MKKMLSFLLCTVLLMALLSPIGALAQEEIVPVSITRDDVSYIEGTRGVWAANPDPETDLNRPWYKYYLKASDYTVTFSDGSTVIGDSREIQLATGEWPEEEDPQSYETAWGVGTHTVPITLGDLVGDYDVTITETPVASIEVSDVSVVYHADGEWQGAYHPETGERIEKAYFYYDIVPSLTVTYKDGTTISGTSDEIHEQTGSSVSILLPYTQYYGHELAIGENTATAVFMGVADDFSVMVEDVVKAVIDRDFVYIKRNFMYGEIPEVSGNVLYVSYADGTHEYIRLDNRMEYYVQGLGGTYPITVTPNRLTHVGKEEISISFLGKTISYTVNVKEPPETVTLTAKEDHSLVMTASYADGSADEVYNILSIPRDWTSASSLGTRTYRGVITTDNGRFYGKVFQDWKKKTVSISLGDGVSYDIFAETNTINEDDWVKAWDMTNEIVWAIKYFHGNTTTFNGVVTEDNAEDILRIGLYDALYRDQTISGSYGPPPGTKDTENYVYHLPVECAQQYVNSAFGVTLDPRQSALYNAENDCIDIVDRNTSRPKHTTVFSEYTPTFVNGCWYIDATVDGEQQLTVVLDNEMRIRSFAFDTVAPDPQLGDITGDNRLNMRDALTLFGVVSSKGTLEPLQRMAADIDGDGKVTLRDTLKLYQAVSGKEAAFPTVKPLEYTELLVAELSPDDYQGGTVRLVRSYEEWQKFYTGKGDRWFNAEQEALFDEAYFETNALVLVEVSEYNIPGTVRIEQATMQGNALNIMVEVGYSEVKLPALYHECRVLQVNAADVADIDATVYVRHEVNILPPNTVA